jgi:hypothetical protein
MMDRSWSVEIAGKKHRIEVDYGRNNSWTGKLMVDGDEVRTWKNYQWLDVPKKSLSRSEASLPSYAKRDYSARINLFFEGKLIKEA